MYEQNAQINMTVETGSGNVAERLVVAREIRLIGDAQGVTNFDGSADVSIFTQVNAISNDELAVILNG